MNCRIAARAATTANCLACQVSERRQAPGEAFLVGAVIGAAGDSLLYLDLCAGCEASQRRIVARHNARREMS